MRRRSECSICREEVMEQVLVKKLEEAEHSNDFTLTTLFLVPCSLSLNESDKPIAGMGSAVDEFGPGAPMNRPEQRADHRIRVAYPCP